VKKQLYLFLLLAILSGCKKFLDKKPDAALVIPEKPADLQRLLDHNNYLNNVYIGWGESSSDNVYVTDADFNSLIEGARNTYTWGDELFYDQSPNAWSKYYSFIYFANTALQELAKMSYTTADKAVYDNVKGSALAIRAYSFLHLLQLWSPAYTPANDNNPYGIPLRLDPDFNIPSVRATVGAGYRQVISDLQSAIPYLPLVPQHRMRPSRPAAYALLAQTYLSMGVFDRARLYADSCLQLQNALIDYNTLNAAAQFPISDQNQEVIWYMYGPNILSDFAKIDSVLYRSYATNDLRRTIFFTGSTTTRFKGNYTGSGFTFAGIATDEIYFIRAECAARAGDVPAALQDLNAVLQKRWKSGTFVPFTAATATDALELVLAERRKELVYREARFADIKRLNALGGQISITRKINGATMVLPPNDNRFCLPIPQNVIIVTHMPQNPR